MNHLKIEFTTESITVDKQPRTTIISGYFEDHRIDPREQLDSGRPITAAKIVEQLDEFTEECPALYTASLVLSGDLGDMASDIIDELVSGRGIRQRDGDDNALREQLACIMGADVAVIHAQGHNTLWNVEPDERHDVEHDEFHDVDTAERLVAALRLLGWHVIAPFAPEGEQTGVTVSRIRK